MILSIWFSWIQIPLTTGKQQNNTHLFPKLQNQQIVQGLLYSGGKRHRETPPVCATYCPGSILTLKLLVFKGNWVSASAVFSSPKGWKLSQGPMPLHACWHLEANPESEGIHLSLADHGHTSQQSLRNSFLICPLQAIRPQPLQLAIAATHLPCWSLGERQSLHPLLWLHPLKKSPVKGWCILCRYLKYSSI